MSTPPAGSPVPRPALDTLREPAHLVSARAPAYWRTKAGISFVVEAVLTVAAWWAIGRFFGDSWWRHALLVFFLLGSVIEVIAAPPIRYRIHRWEVTPDAVFTRSGWLTRTQRIAPLARVQTVDTKQGALMRLFGLSSITVTTASSAGAISIDCLDDEVAQRVVAELTEITARTEGDGT